MLNESRKFCPFHPNPPFPEGREGVPLALKPVRQFETFARKPKFPSFQRKEGVGENGDTFENFESIHAKIRESARQDIFEI